MTSRLPALLVLLFGGCRIYQPTVVDCAFRCGPSDACPVDTECREGFCRVPGATSRCDCRSGDDRTCGGGPGECTPGVQRCSSEGTWGPCVGEVKPTDERCDRKDNNCDGQIDNGVSLGPPCARTLGVCASATRRCVDGAHVDCDDADYGPDFQTFEDRCDGKDNDCDGIIDGTAERRLATDVAGDWEILPTPGGFTVVYLTSGTSSGLDVAVDRRTAALELTGSGRIPTGMSSTAMAARAEGSDVFVAWLVPDGVRVRRVAADGTVTPLADGPSLGAVDQLRLGVSSALVVAVVRVGNEALSLEWPRSAPGTPPTVRRLNAEPDGGASTTSLDGVVASTGGRYVGFRGDFRVEYDGGSSTDSVYRLFQAGGGPLVSTVYPGVSSTVFEALGGRVVAVYSTWFTGFPPFFPSYSQVNLITNLLDGGTTETVRQSTDPFTWRAAHGVAVPSGVAMVYLNNTEGQMLLSSVQLGLIIPLVRSRTIDADAGTGTPRVASDSNGYLAVGYLVGPTLYGKRLCAP